MEIFIKILLTFFGILMFYIGYKKLREASLVARIRETPVRDIGTGIVRLFGKVEGEYPLISPLTGMPCYYYRATARKLVRNGRTLQWNDCKKATAQRDFYLNDGTGRVRIVPEEAEFIGLTATLEAKLGGKSGYSCELNRSLQLAEPAEERLRGLLTADWKQVPVAGVGVPAPPIHEKEEKKEKWWVPESIEIEGLGELKIKEEAREYSISEEALVAGQEYSIVGTCEQDASQNTKVVRKGTANKSFVISPARGSLLTRKIRVQGLALVGISLTLLAFLTILSLTHGHWEVEGHESATTETTHAE